MRVFILIACMALCGRTWADEPFRGLFTCERFSVCCQLNLYAADIPVPGLEEEMCFGYLKGRLNGTWVILRVKELSEEEALVRAVNDKGSEAQDLRLTLTSTGVELRQVDGSSMKGVEGKKYVKLPKPLVLERMK